MLARALWPQNALRSLVDRMYNAVVNLVGVAIDSRPEVASEMLRRLSDVRAAKGRPHWFVIDEAHHVFPSDVPAQNTLLAEPPGTSLMITVHPDHVRKEALGTVVLVVRPPKEEEDDQLADEDWE